MTWHDIVELRPQRCVSCAAFCQLRLIQREGHREGEKNEGLMIKTKCRPLQLCDLFSFLEKHS